MCRSIQAVFFLVLATPALALDQAGSTVTITGSAAGNGASVAGFGDVTLARSPFSATVIGSAQLQDAGIAGLADITRLDAALADAYNAPGYWGQLAARGFTLDNRQNYRRDGLPINAETVLATANKSGLELFKGTSGLQAGISAPGGLLNLVVKRPTAMPLTSGAIEWVQPGTMGLQADISRRAGNLGWRLNAAATRLEPPTRASRGSSRLLAAAVAWSVGDTLIETEVESSRQSQPSTPGFSLLGNTLPHANREDPRLNLNNQAWSLPVVFEGQTASLRLTQPLAADWTAVLHLMQQRLRTDDRIAFPFGCGAEGNFNVYCSDGSFDFYDFRSEGERRRSDALDLGLQGRLRLAGLTHHLGTGLLLSRHAARFGRQAFNFVGTGTVDGLGAVPADPTLTDENTQRDERSTEWRLQDRIELGPRWQLWSGLRATRIERRSVRTDGSRPTDYAQTFTTPWLALVWQATPGLMLYGSAGQGVETEVAPNRTRYSNAGQPLPALKSRQWEAGLKTRGETVQWQLVLFDIRRPQWNDILDRSGLPSDACSDSDPCTRRADGHARHRGIETEAEWQQGSLNWRASLLWLHARREGSAAAAINGLRPTNVPARSAKVQAAWNVAALPGLALLAFASHESAREVLPDNRVQTPGFTRLDVGLRYAHTPAGPSGSRWVWRAGIDNLGDQRAWKESPYQFGHAYLYPLAPRTARVSLQVSH
jgi:iron complex outermembrane recepter protein